MTDFVMTVEDLRAGYGSGDIIKGANLQVPVKGISTIVGPNGAGKSTLIKSLVGLLDPKSGSITLNGSDVTHLDATAKARAGLGYVPQENNVFRNMTIRENLAIAYEFIARDKKKLEEARNRVFSIFPDLVGRQGELAGNLSGGQRQMLAFGCALMPNPTLLLLDEPSAGLSPRYVTEMFQAVQTVNNAGVSVLMIEQNVKDAMQISDTAIVLVAGTIRSQMSSSGFLNHPDMHALYMGLSNAPEGKVS